MGKLLDSLLKLNGQHGCVATSPAQPCQQQETIESTHDCEQVEEEYPYIEVGAPGKKIDASAVVLAAGPASVCPATPPQVPPFQVPSPAPVAELAPVQPALVPTLSQSGPISVSFEPVTAAAAKKPAREIVTYHQPDHPIARQYGELYTHIVGSLDDDAGVVVLAGAAPKMGTTTVLLNLAFSGCTRRRIALVEGNLLRPSMTGKLGMEKAPGLLDVLAGTVALEKAMLPTAAPALHVLLAGTNKATARSVTPEALRWVLGWLRDRYPLVLVDAPDLSEAEEVERLASAADALYLVAPREENLAGQLAAWARTISRRGGRLRGFIHTHFENM